MSAFNHLNNTYPPPQLNNIDAASAATATGDNKNVINLSLKDIYDNSSGTAQYQQQRQQQSVNYSGGGLFTNAAAVAASPSVLMIPAAATSPLPIIPYQNPFISSTPNIVQPNNQYIPNSAATNSVLTTPNYHNRNISDTPTMLTSIGPIELDNNDYNNYNNRFGSGGISGNNNNGLLKKDSKPIDGYYLNWDLFFRNFMLRLFYKICISVLSLSDIDPNITNDLKRILDDNDSGIRNIYKSYKPYSLAESAAAASAAVVNNTSTSAPFIHKLYSSSAATAGAGISSAMNDKVTSSYSIDTISVEFILNKYASYLGIWRNAIVSIQNDIILRENDLEHTTSKFLSQAYSIISTSACNSFSNNPFHNNSFHDNPFHNNSFHNNPFHNNQVSVAATAVGSSNSVYDIQLSLITQYIQRYVESIQSYMKWIKQYQLYRMSKQVDIHEMCKHLLDSSVEQWDKLCVKFIKYLKRVEDEKKVYLEFIQQQQQQHHQDQHIKKQPHQITSSNAYTADSSDTMIMMSTMKGIMKSYPKFINEYVKSIGRMTTLSSLEKNIQDLVNQMSTDILDTLLKHDVNTDNDIGGSGSRMQDLYQELIELITRLQCKLDTLDNERKIRQQQVVLTSSSSNSAGSSTSNHNLNVAQDPTKTEFGGSGGGVNEGNERLNKIDNKNNKKMKNFNRFLRFKKKEKLQKEQQKLNEELKQVKHKLSDYEEIDHIYNDDEQQHQLINSKNHTPRESTRSNTTKNTSTTTTKDPSTITTKDSSTTTKDPSKSKNDSRKPSKRYQKLIEEKNNITKTLESILEQLNAIELEEQKELEDAKGESIAIITTSKDSSSAAGPNITQQQQQMVPLNTSQASMVLQPTHILSSKFAEFIEKHRELYGNKIKRFPINAANDAVITTTNHPKRMSRREIAACKAIEIVESETDMYITKIRKCIGEDAKNLFRDAIKEYNQKNTDIDFMCSKIEEHFNMEKDDIIASMSECQQYIMKDFGGIAAPFLEEILNIVGTYISLWESFVKHTNAIYDLECVKMLQDKYLSDCDNLMSNMNRQVFSNPRNAIIPPTTTIMF